MNFDLLLERAKATEPIVRASTINLFNDCPRKCWFMHKAGVFPRVPAVSVAMNTGSVFHAIMEYTLKDSEFNLDVGLTAAEKQLNGEIQRLKDLWETLESPDAKDLCTISINKLGQCFSLAKVMAVIWWKIHPPQFSPGDVLFTEQEVEGDIDKVPCAGRIDYAVKTAQPPHFCLLDYKTTSRSPELVMAGRRYDLALYIYCNLAERIYKRKPAGMIYNIIQRPTIRFCGKDKGIFSNYVERVKKWYGDLSVDAMTSRFIPFTGGLPGLTSHEFWEIIKGFDVVRRRPHPQWWPRRSGYCTSLYGESCPYFDLCNSTPQVWEPKLKDFSIPPLTLPAE